jgi:hypothetical protein
VFDGVVYNYFSHPSSSCASLVPGLPVQNPWGTSFPMWSTPRLEAKRVCDYNATPNLVIGFYVERLLVFFEFLLECALLSCRFGGLSLEYISSNRSSSWRKNAILNNYTQYNPLSPQLPFAF